MVMVSGGGAGKKCRRGARGRGRKEEVRGRRIRGGIVWRGGGGER